MPNSSSFRLMLCFVVGIGGFAIRPPSAAAQGEPTVEADGDQSGGMGPVSGPRVAAAGREQVVIAWFVENGEHQGLYYRQRRNYLWDPMPTRITGYGTRDPRDVNIAYDQRGMAHMVWTALLGERRRVFYTRIDESGAAMTAKCLNPLDATDADYPLVFVIASLGYFFFWQAEGPDGVSVESARYDPQLQNYLRLPPVSGASQSAMTPRVVDDSPLVVAWYEILEKGNELRFSRYDFLKRDWSETQWRGAGEDLPLDNQPLFLRQGMANTYAYWAQDGPEGSGSIRLAGRLGGIDKPFEFKVLDQPPGDHQRPHFIDVGDVGHGRLTGVWQVLSQGRQSIRLAAVDWENDQTTVLAIGEGLHRFASDPWHCGTAQWSLVVWNDEARDGGTGRLGFAEVTWN